MEIKSKRQLQLITLSWQLEIGWNPVGFLRPPSAISGAVWAGRFGVCGWRCLSCDCHLWLLGCAWHRCHHQNTAIVSWQILHRNFEFQFKNKQTNNLKRHFVHDWTLLFFSHLHTFPISSHPHQNLPSVLCFGRWEEATFREILDISLVCRGIGMWPKMWDAQGVAGELVWSNRCRNPSGQLNFLIFYDVSVENEEPNF